MDGIKQKLKKNGVVILFFLVFLVYGLLTVRDYGISTDEMIERESSLITYRYIVPSVADIVTDTVNFPELPPLKEYKDRYYGMAVQIPAVAVEHLFGFQLDIRKVFLMRHLYNFLMYFAAACIFYRICRKLGNSGRLSLLGTSLFILMPRLLANAYYNIKDMMFLAVFVIALYFGLLCIEKLSWKRMLPFAFFGALCTNVRIVGAMVIAVCLLAAFARSVAEKRWKPAFWRCWAAAVLCFGFYYLLTPIIWQDTFREIQGLLETFSSYLVWYTKTYFCGEYILATELPWYYLFVNIGITTPVFYLLMFFVGAGCLVFHGIQKVGRSLRPQNNTGKQDIANGNSGTGKYNKIFGNRGARRRDTVYDESTLFRASGKLSSGMPPCAAPLSCAVARQGRMGVYWDSGSGKQDRPGGASLSFWYYLAVVCCLVIPFVYVLVSRPVLYNGWRHFYFVYPMMALVMLYGIREIGMKLGSVGKKPAACAYWCVVLANMLAVLLWIGRNHPYEYCFFNRLALPYVTKYFQKDYWNVSQYDLLNYACENDSREKIKVWILPTNAIYYMPPEHRYRIVHVGSEDSADYIVTNYTASYEEERLPQYYLYEEPKTVMVDGVKISSLFQRAYDVSMRGILSERENGGSFCYNANGMDWEISREGDETVFHGVSGQEIPLDKLFVSSENIEVMESLQISVSSDGNTFTELELSKEYPSVDSDRSSVLGLSMGVKEVVLRHRAAEEASLDLCFLARRDLDGEQVKPLSLVSEATASHLPEQASLALDGNRASRWTSGTAQTEGMFYELTLKEPVEITGLMLDTDTSPGDEGRNLEIFYKDNSDGEWMRLEAETGDGIYYYFSGNGDSADGKEFSGEDNTDAPAVTVCALRLEVGTVEADNINNWSIHELNLLAERQVSSGQQHSYPE